MNDGDRIFLHLNLDMNRIRVQSDTFVHVSNSLFALLDRAGHLKLKASIR